MKKIKVLNSKGEPVSYSDREKRLMNYLQAKANSLGYEIDITTLTGITKQVTEQKFYEIPFADYVPVKVGENAFAGNIVTYRSFKLGGSFAEGVLNMGSNSGRLAQADAAIDSLSIKVLNWGKGEAWNIFDLEQAARSGNWDLVTAKEEARKTNWDLGLQEVAFLGLKDSQGVCLGLLNQSGIAVNTTVITKPIKDMSPAELKTLTGSLIEAYRANCNRTAWPSVFVVPESDYNGLVNQSSPDFPIKSTLEVLEEALKLGTRNPKFKIMPLSYADMAYSGFTYQSYALYNQDPKSIRMDVPVDYTNTLANSIDNFMFQNVGYGQFTGVLAYRPKELLYLQYTPS